MRKIYLILPLLFSLLAVACDDDAEIVRLTNEDPVLSVSSISPQRGYAGTEVTIEGVNFGAAKELVKVFFAGMEESAELLTCEDSKLVVKVPENAASGALTIEVNKMRIVTSDRLFTVISNPEMTEISPARAVGNTEITVIGKDFGTVAEDALLYCTIDGEEVPFTITSCMDEEIKAIVPETIVFGEFDLKVRIKGKEAKNTLKITLLEKPTVTTVKSDNVLNESFAFAGDRVTISGTGFGTDANAVTVKFGELNAASIESCVNSKIVAVVPEGFAGGAITVTKDGLSSTSADELKVLEDNMDISSYVLKNYRQPFKIDPNMTDEQLGTSSDPAYLPADWIVNDAARSITNTGASEKVAGLYKDNLILQAGWGANNFKNGKLYQTTTLPKGKYRLTVNLNEYGTRNYSTLYVAVVAGNELPDVTNIEDNESVKGFYKITGEYKQPSSVEIEFELTEKSTDVALGFVCSLIANGWFKARELKLELLKIII